jgi:hypothetical protein
MAARWPRHAGWRWRVGTDESDSARDDASQNFSGQEI